MPDGYGDRLPSWAIDLPRHPQPKSWPPDHGTAAVARLARALGFNKSRTLEICGLKKTPDNYHWLSYITGEDEEDQ